METIVIFFCGQTKSKVCVGLTCHWVNLHSYFLYYFNTSPIFQVSEF
jgi:hypothetical protein